MAKTKVSEFDAVASNNTDINSVNVAEGCPPSGINNAIREMASLLKKQEVGTDAMTSPDINGGTIDGATIGGSSGVTIGVSDGTVSAPSIKFTSDTNTGIYRGGTDILKFVTAGTDAVTIDASQNVDINGTVTADGLTVSTDSYRQLLLTFPDSFTSKLQLGFSNFYLQGSGTTDELTIANNSSGQTKFINQSKTSMLIDNSGDISFYEDTGSTPKMVWKASNERLGIGTSSPDVPLEVQMTQNGGAPATSGTTQTYGILRLQGTTFTSALDFGTNGGNYAWIQSTDQADLSTNYRLSLNPNGGNVGIGVLTPTSIFEVSGSNNDNWVGRFENTNTGGYGGLFITAGSTSNDIAFDVRKNTSDSVLRILGNGHVGINNTSPASALDVTGNILTSTALYLNSLSVGSMAYFSYSSGNPKLWNTVNGALIFGTNNTERMRILPSGGITFNGDTATANALDDYEEGTFDVTLVPQTSGSITVNGVYNALAYTKIGRTVTVTGAIVISSVSSPVGDYVNVVGLPFTIGDFTDLSERFAPSITYNDNSAGTLLATGGIALAGSQFRINKNANTFANNDDIYFNFTYFTS